MGCAASVPSVTGNSGTGHSAILFRALAADDARTERICDDIAEAVNGGRRGLVLTQWTRHLASIVDGLRTRGHEPLVLQGGLGVRERRAVQQSLEEHTTGPLILLATASYLGEGFDCPPLDTLFLAFPIAFKGRIVQYVGRVLRPTDGKADVVVHDYVDTNVPVIAKMQNKRLPGYRALGFPAPSSAAGNA